MWHIDFHFCQIYFIFVSFFSGNSEKMLQTSTSKLLPTPALNSTRYTKERATTTTTTTTTTRGRKAAENTTSTRTSRFSRKRNHNTTKSSSVSENAKMMSSSHLGDGDEEQQKRMSTTKNTIDFLSICGKLKQTRRTGWTKYEEITSQVESVADHSFRIALMAFVFGLQQQREGGDKEEDKEEKVLDVQKLVTMALVHDIAESIVGDITPHCGISKEEKNKLEVEAMQKLKETLGDVAGETIETLWLEYENGSSREARVVKELDKLEMLLQASEYENEYKDVDLTEFYSSCDGSFKTENGKRWVEEILRRRPVR